MTPDEDRQLRTLGNALEVVPDWVRLTGRPTGQQPVPGSDLAADDRRTNPYHVSHAAWTAMLAAVSHLACLRDSLFYWSGPDQVEARIHTHGQFSLVRGALENASRAVWMLEPDNRDERLLRRLRLEWAESSALDKVRELIGTSGQSKDDRLKKLIALLRPTAVDPDEIKSLQNSIKSKADYVTIVEAAGAHLASGSSRQLVIWRACSALAHGDFRGTLAYTAKEVQPGQTPGLALAQVTGSVPLLTQGSLVAIQTMKVALRLYGKRAG